MVLLPYTLNNKTKNDILSTTVIVPNTNILPNIEEYIHLQKQYSTNSNQPQQSNSIPESKFILLGNGGNIYAGYIVNLLITQYNNLLSKSITTANNNTKSKSSSNTTPTTESDISLPLPPIFQQKQIHNLQFLLDTLTMVEEMFTIINKDTNNIDKDEIVNNNHAITETN